MTEDNEKIYEGLKAPGRRGSFSKIALELGTTRQNVRYALINNSNPKIIAAAAKLWKELAEFDNGFKQEIKDNVQIAQNLDGHEDN